MVKKHPKKSVSPKRKCHRVLRTKLHAKYPAHLRSFSEEFPSHSWRSLSRLNTSGPKSRHAVLEESDDQPSFRTSSNAIKSLDDQNLKSDSHLQFAVGDVTATKSIQAPLQYKESIRCLSLIKYAQACNLAGLPALETDSGRCGLLYQVILLKSKLLGNNPIVNLDDKGLPDYCNICWRSNISPLETIQLCCWHRFHCVCLVSRLVSHSTCPTCFTPVSLSK